jgi:excisionase family DNA binding protein
MARLVHGRSTSGPIGQDGLIQIREVGMTFAGLDRFDHTSDSRDNDLYELLTVEDVAALLKVSKSWVYEHTRARHVPRTERLPHVKVGKYVRFERRALRAFLEKQRCRTS